MLGRGITVCHSFTDTRGRRGHFQYKNRVAEGHGCEGEARSHGLLAGWQLPASFRVTGWGDRIPPHLVTCDMSLL